MLHVKRLAGFSTVPALSMLASLALLPLIAQQFGASGWMALGIGQSAGAIASAFVALAWPVIGGHRIASQTSIERAETYKISTLSRLITLLVTVPVMALFLLILLPAESAFNSTLFMVGFALNGMNASWYFSGTGEPRYLVRNEGFVRLASYGIALIGMLCGLGLWWYGLTTIAAGCTSILLNWITIVGARWPVTRKDLGVALKVIPAQMSAAVAKILQALFYQGANTVFTIFAPSALAMYSAADQVKRVAANALSVLPAAFVFWVGASRGRQLRRRQRISVLLAVTVSVALIGLWWFFGDFVIYYLFAGEIELPKTQSMLLIGVIVANYLTLSTELLLMVPSGLERVVFLTNSVCAVLGITALAFAAHHYGAEGGLAVLLIVKVTILIVYSISLFITLKSRDKDTVRADSQAVS